MSKSLGNFFTLRDLLAKGSAGREVRYLMISAHYRETFNFTLENLAGAKTALGRIDECTAKLRELALGQAAKPAADSPLITRFTEAMDDDLNVSAAWAAAFDWVRDTNRKLAAEELDAASAATELANWEKINSVLGIETVEISAGRDSRACRGTPPPARRKTLRGGPDPRRTRSPRLGHEDTARQGSRVLKNGRRLEGSSLILHALDGSNWVGRACESVKR